MGAASVLQEVVPMLLHGLPPAARVRLIQLRTGRARHHAVLDGQRLVAQPERAAREVGGCQRVARHAAVVVLTPRLISSVQNTRVAGVPCAASGKWWRSCAM